MSGLVYIKIISIKCSLIKLYIYSLMKKNEIKKINKNKSSTRTQSVPLHRLLTIPEAGNTRHTSKGVF